MLHLEIKNYGRIKSASVTLKPGVNLVIGGNRAGKSTLLRALASVNNPALSMVPEGVLKKESRLLVTEGEGACNLAVTYCNQEPFVVKYPQNTTSGTSVWSKPPSAIALGLVRWSTMGAAAQKAAMSVLSPGATVTIDDLLREAGELDPDIAARVQQCRSLDEAYRVAGVMATELTGAWKRVTGANYGSKLALTWAPEGFDPEWTADGLQQALKDAEQALQTAYQDLAVDAHKLEQARAVADPGADRFAEQEERIRGRLRAAQTEHADAMRRQDDREQQINARVAAFEQAQASLNRLREEYKRETRRTPPASIQCPHCQGALMVTDGAISEHDPSGGPRQEVLDRLVEQSRGVQKAIDEMQIQVVLAEKQAIDDRKIYFSNSMQQYHSEAESAINDIAARRWTWAENKNRYDKAQKFLRENEGKAGIVTPEQVADLENRVDRCREDTRKLQDKREADKIQAQIQQWGVIYKLAGPDGLQRTARESVLADVNHQLTTVSGVLGVDVITINADGEIFSAGRPPALMSTAERRLADIVLQLMHATAENVGIVLLDEVGVITDELVRVRLFDAAIPMVVDPMGAIVVAAMSGKPGNFSHLFPAMATVHLVKNGEINAL